MPITLLVEVSNSEAMLTARFNKEPWIQPARPPPRPLITLASVEHMTGPISTPASKAKFDAWRSTTQRLLNLPPLLY